MLIYCLFPGCYAPGFPQGIGLEEHFRTAHVLSHPSSSPPSSPPPPSFSLSSHSDEHRQQQQHQLQHQQQHQQQYMHQHPQANYSVPSRGRANSDAANAVLPPTIDPFSQLERFLDVLQKGGDLRGTLSLGDGSSASSTSAAPQAQHVGGAKKDPMSANSSGCKWRCAQCLQKIALDDHGYVCPFCRLT
ncbi:hypothetical protein AAL_06503 [Moelleriella libera RCEF 2490]|uniref:Uncharacterized protein n=1 Tax=Moelleriella libera RCEF 2490 TaxID=1081109 RepID=A0A167YTP9_9HYPO|nr:hypothetical protein AAL_06503 [Moelleriella libera RCEF 2490]